MIDWQSFAQLVVSGFTMGCVYALVALGFVMCANVSGLINFAQGEYVMIGGLVTASLSAFGTPLALAVACASVCGGILGILQERLTLAPIRRYPVFIQITVSLGVAEVLRGSALGLFGKDPLSVPDFSGGDVLDIGGVLLVTQTIWVWATTAVLLGLVFYFLNYTEKGRAVRACASNAVAAQLMGIRLAGMGMIVFAAAGVAGALAGAVIAPIALANWSVGIEYGIKGFVGALLGGFRNPMAAVMGGIALGIVEELSTGYIASGSKDVVSYSLLLIFLFIRGGIFAGGRRPLLGVGQH